MSDSGQQRQSLGKAQERQRHKVARAACNGCRQRKLRCDLRRPACSVCVRTKRQCEYVTAHAGETRNAAMRRELENLQQENERLRAHLKEVTNDNKINSDFGKKQQHKRSSFATQIDPLVAHGRDNSDSNEDMNEQNLNTPFSDASALLSMTSSNGLPTQLSAASMLDLIRTRINQDEESIFQHPSTSSGERPHVEFYGRMPTYHHEHDSTQDRVATQLLEALTTLPDDLGTLLFAGLRLGLPCGEVHAAIFSGRTVRALSPKPCPDRIMHDADLAGIAIDESYIPGRLDDAIQALNPNAALLQNDIIGLFHREYWESQIHLYEDFGQSLDADNSSKFPVIVASNLHNYFGNLGLTAAIGANHHPLAVQNVQRSNVHLPVWAVQTMNDPRLVNPRSQNPALVDPFEAIFAGLQVELESSSSLHDFCGQHAYIGALDNEATFQLAPRLSQVVARMVKSVKPDETSMTITQVGLMWGWWSLLRWMLMPSQNAYNETPEFLRPTARQAFVVHPRTYDFLVSPLLRDHVCNVHYTDARWLTEGCITVSCDFEGTVSDALCFHDSTGEMTLKPASMTHIKNANNWCLGSSIRTFIPNIDLFVKIRH